MNPLTLAEKVIIGLFALAAILLTIMALPASAATLYEFKGTYTSWFAGDQFGNMIEVQCHAPTMDCTAHGTAVVDDNGNVVAFTYRDASYDYTIVAVCGPLDCHDEYQPTNVGGYNFAWVSASYQFEGASGPLPESFAFWMDWGHFDSSAGTFELVCCDGSYHHTTFGVGQWRIAATANAPPRKPAPIPRLNAEPAPHVNGPGMPRAEPGQRSATHGVLQ